MVADFGVAEAVVRGKLGVSVCEGVLDFPPNVHVICDMEFSKVNAIVIHVVH